MGLDMEKLIRDAVKNKSDNLELKLPNADILWKKIQEQEKLTNKKKKEKREFGITGWLEIAAVLLIIIFLPVTVTKLRSSQTGQINPSSMQETVAVLAEIEEAKKVASSFLTEFYTIEDYNSFTQQDDMLYPNDNKTKRIRIYTTDKYFIKNLVPNRDLLLMVKAAQRNKCNFQVDKITLTKYTEDMKNKSIVFTTEVNLYSKFIDGSEKPASFRGQITMQNENDKWKVNYYTVTSLEPKEIFNNVTEDKTNMMERKY